MTGASFAEPNNKWFELGCKSLGVNAINKAVGGESIADTANKMAAGTLYSSDEFEKWMRLSSCTYMKKMFLMRIV